MAICLIPLFFINIKSSHDWGDDFAQYIHQAKNIVDGQSQNETGYIFNEHCFTGPVAYPAGFPILLSPLVKKFGYNFYVFNLYQTFFLLLTCVIGFVILRKHFSFLTAFFTALIIAYNPVFLNFKTEIISDLPFAFFSLLTIYLIPKKSNWFVCLVLGLLIAFSIHLRSIGVLLLLAFLVQKLFLENNFRTLNFKNQKFNLITFVCCALVYFSIQFLFPCNTNYPYLIDSGNFWETINEHFSYNLQHLSWLFRGYEIKNYYSIGIVASSVLIAFSLIGLVHFFRENKKSIYVYYFLVYCLVAFAYKHSHAGMRFLYPVLPFIFLFCIYGIKKNLETLIPNQKWIAIVMGILILYSYQDEIKKIQEHTNDVADGPHTAQSYDLFQFINSNLPKNAVVEFDKPRALALYAQVQSFALFPAATLQEIKQDLKKLKAEYYLTNETQSTEVIKNYPLQHPENFKIIFENQSFKLFQILN